MPPWVIAIGTLAVIGFLLTHLSERKNSSPQQSDSSLNVRLQSEDQILQQLRPMKVSYQSQPDPTIQATPPSSNNTAQGEVPPSAISNTPVSNSNGTPTTVTVMSSSQPVVVPLPTPTPTPPTAPSIFSPGTTGGSPAIPINPSSASISIGSGTGGAISVGTNTGSLAG